MPRSRSSTSSTSILNRVGLAGAAARFTQRSYAADYIALGVLIAGWLMVGLLSLNFVKIMNFANCPSNLL